MATRGSSSKRNTSKRSTSRRSTSSAARSRSASDSRKREARTIDYNENGLTDEIILFVFVAICIVLLLSNFDLIGSVGEALSAFQFGMFGVPAYVFPILIAFGAFFLYSNIENATARIRTVSGAVLYTDVCVISHLLVIKEQAAANPSIYTFCAQTKKGGGAVGGTIARLMYDGLGTLGAWIIALLIFVVCFILVTGISVLGVAQTGGQRVSDSARRGYERSKERARERAMLRQEQEEKRQAELKLRMDMKAAPGVSLDTKLTSEASESSTDIREIHAKSEQTLDGTSFTLLNDEASHLDDSMDDISHNADAGSDSDSSYDSDEDTSSKTLSFDMDRLSEEEFDYDMAQMDLENRLSSALLAKRTSAMTEEMDFEASNDEFVPGSKGTESVVADEVASLPVADETEVSSKPVSSGIKKVKAETYSDGPKIVKPKKKNWRLPRVNDDSLLKNWDLSETDTKDYLNETAIKLRDTLKSFGINVEMTEVSQGPTVTRYEMKPEIGVKVSRIVALSDDLQLALASKDIRIEAPVPGKSAVGIEVPNAKSSIVGIKEMLSNKEYRNFKGKLSFAVGKGLGGESVIADIAKMPHLLIAGTTGSGKSVCMNTLILSLLFKYTPEQVRMIMIDPKVVELSIYNDIPHLLIPVVSDPKQASAALHWGVVEMDRRYEKFAEARVRDLEGYNAYVEEVCGKNKDVTLEKLPQIVIIVDELADLMMTAAKEVEESIARIAQKARACGIHLVIATQRPSVNVITGLIKANIPSRIAFAVSSGVDSRTILDSVGAEKLLGHGDMLFYPQGYSKPVRLQGPFVTDDEVRNVTKFWKDQNDGATNEEAELIKSQMLSSGSGGNTSAEGAVSNSDSDEFTVDAARLIVSSNKASIGMLQRKFRIGFNRAARIMEELADAGVVGEDEGTKPRKILMSEEELENFIEQGYL